MEKLLNRSEKKILRNVFIGITVFLCLLLVSLIAVYAWFSNFKSLKTATRVNTPANLFLGTGNSESIQRLSLGDIDVKEVDADGSGRKLYVFSVSSDYNVNKYTLQLSHTTNIDFNYKIYRARDLGNDRSNDGNPNTVSYEATDGKTYFYRIGNKADSTALDEISLIPQNLSDDGRNANEYAKTYNEYENVQIHAKPVYYKAFDIKSDYEGKYIGEQGFVDYFILEISWEKNKVINDKETDMVYIMSAVS